MTEINLIRKTSTSPVSFITAGANVVTIQIKKTFAFCFVPTM